MRPRSAQELARVCSGTVVGEGATLGTRVITDTRGAVRGGDVFVALVGPRFDGSRFAEDAFSAGASVVIAAGGAGIEVPEGRALVVVEDALAALQALAGDERTAFSGEVVAITGSNGKTITKDMLAAALGGMRRVYASPMSYNSQVGVALALLELDPEAEVAIIECGISRPGEMERLAAMVRPTHGIFVNVGDSHLEGLGSRTVTAEQKALLFGGLPADGWCLVSEGESEAMVALDALGVRYTVVGEVEVADALGLVAGFRQDARLAVSAAMRLGASAAAAAAGLVDWEPAPMRMEVLRTPRGVTVINDAYTADPGSMEAALTALSRFRGGRRVAVLGGMSQLGAASVRAHEQVGRRLVELGVNTVIGVGEGGAAIVRSALAAGLDGGSAVVVDDVASAASVIEERVDSGDVVLLKASRPQRLERIAPLLFGAVAPARATIDIDTLVENLRAFEQVVGPGVAVMPVVKSFGYGLGAARMALELQHAGVRYFCVAYADEGVELREAGVVAPILVQNVVPEDAPKVAAHGLTAELGSLDQVRVVAEAAAHARRSVNVHVKVDTGMGRSGTRLEGAVDLALAVEAAEWLELEGLMTHFAASDEPEHDGFTRLQIERFDGVLAALERAGVRPRWVHACNSAGAARFPGARYSMVRAGIGLLGYSDPAVEGLLRTRPVLRLTTRVVATKTIEVGEPVGYGLSWTATRRTPIATVALGYGDGYPRALSNRGWMSIDGFRCPVVGRVCMDVTMIDVSAVGREVHAGEEVVVYGTAPDEPDLCAHAAAIDTIPYELLTRLSSRVRRIFRRTH